MKKISITKRDGIGPEIMDATLKIMMAAGAQVDIDEIKIGGKVYLEGNSSGIDQQAWQTHSSK